MFQEALKHYPYLSLNIVAMFLFMAVFAGVLVWISRRSSTEAYRSIERLALDDHPSTEIRTGKKI